MPVLYTDSHLALQVSLYFCTLIATISGRETSRIVAMMMILLRLLLLEVRRSLMPKVTSNLPPASIILHAEGG